MAYSTYDVETAGVVCGGVVSVCITVHNVEALKI